MFTNRGLALRFKQGSRTMYASAEGAESLFHLLTTPKVFEPDAKSVEFGTNRPIDKAHKDRIAEYYRTEKNFVDGARIFHVSPGDINFEEIEVPGHPKGDAVAVGWISFRQHRVIDIGDGQHRLNALYDVLNSEDTPDEVRGRIAESAFPFILVEEEGREKRNQDFVDLSRSKPVADSLANVMDRRSVVNKLPDVIFRSDKLKPYFLGNSSRYRVAFGGSISAKSEKLLPYSALKYALLTLFVGEGTRVKAKAENETALRIQTAGSEKVVAERVAEIWRYVFVSLPGTQKIMTDKSPNVPDIRDEYLSVSAAALYAICLALYTIAKEHGGIMKVPDDIWKRAVDKWATRLNWGKHSDSSFVGTILTPTIDKRTGAPTGRYTTTPGRDAVAGAARVLLETARDTRSVA
jgi:DGQHR domain-containing protein